MDSYWGLKNEKAVRKLKIKDVAELLGKTRFEVKEMLKTNEVIELNLNERKTRYKNREDDELRIFE